MHQSVLNIPSGSLSTPNINLDAPCPKRDQGTKLITGYKGNGFRHQRAGIYRTTLSHYWLPEGHTGWNLNSRDKQVFKDVTERLERLLEDEYADDYYKKVVEEVLQREATPGTLEALRFCDRFLVVGGLLDELGKVGNVVLNGGFDYSFLSADNVTGISTVSKALFDSGCGHDQYKESLMIAHEYVDCGDYIADIINTRGITDGGAIKALLSNTNSSPSAVRSGIL